MKGTMETEPVADERRYEAAKLLHSQMKYEELNKKYQALKEELDKATAAANEAKAIADDLRDKLHTCYDTREAAGKEFLKAIREKP